MSEIGLYLCPNCNMILYSDEMELPEGEEISCALCGWKDPDTEPKKISMSEWRNFLFRIDSDAGIKPMPRNVFYISFAEMVPRLVPDITEFMQKWGVLGTEELNNPVTMNTIKFATILFMRTVIERIEENKDKTEQPAEGEKEASQIELPFIGGEDE